MKITIINGSARKGNTYAAVNALAEGAAANNEVEIIEAHKLQLNPCMGCDACGCVKGCVAKEDTNPTVDKLVDSDIIIFASPVYWWGITGQIKLLIDKCYCKGAYLKNKKIGLVVVGADDIETVQYDLIKGQFDCIAEYLNWDIAFFKKYSASARGELAANQAIMAELKAVGEAL